MVDLHWGMPYICCLVWALSRGMWDLVSWPGIEPEPPKVEERNLSHCNTREVPTPHFIHSFKGHLRGFHIPPIVYKSMFLKDRESS